MRNENNYYHYNLKKMLIKVLRMLGLDKKSASNAILIQDITAFLLDMHYQFFEFDFCFQMMDGNGFSVDEFKSQYNEEVNTLYNYLKKFLNITIDHNYVSIERISSIVECTNSKYFSCFEGYETYYKGDINSVINDIVFNMRESDTLASRKIVIFTNSNYTIRYITRYELGKRVNNYNIYSAQLGLSVVEDIETYSGSKVVNLQKSIYNKTFDNVDLINLNEREYFSKNDCILKKIYNVKNNIIDFSLMNDGYYGDDKFDITFSVPLSYDVWSLDFHNIDMNIHEKSDYERMRYYAHERDCSCLPKDDFIVNTLVIGADIESTIEHKIEEELYKIYNGRQYRK